MQHGVKVNQWVEEALAFASLKSYRCGQCTWISTKLAKLARLQHQHHWGAGELEKRVQLLNVQLTKRVQSYPQEYHQREMCASLCGKEATQQARARSQHSLDGLRDAQDVLCCSHWTCCWTSCAAPTPHALDDQGGVDENHKSDWWGGDLLSKLDPTRQESAKLSFTCIIKRG